MKKSLFTLFATLLIIFNISVDVQAQHRGGAKTPKYIFLFIGDGMSQAHISLTEAYLATQKGTIGNEPFSFTKFPITGLATTYSASSYITCSSAAGTAIATGTKTNNGMLGIDPQEKSLKSFAYKLKEKGLVSKPIFDLSYGPDRFKNRDVRLVSVECFQRRNFSK